MRRTAVVLVAAACLQAAAPRAQDRYAEILFQYLANDSDAAVARLVALPHDEIRAGVDAFDTTRSRLVLTGAAAMHTEVAFSRSGAFVSEFHLQVATAIIEFGERSGVKTNAPFGFSPQFAMPVSNEFRRLWYCTVINGLESAAMMGRADKYLEHALALFSDHAEVRLLAGVAAEMHASPRTSAAGARERRHALGEAEKHYRAALASDPGRLEARLRLGRVLQQRDELAEARALLAPLVDGADARIAYLSALFLGGIEDREHHENAAAALYERAAALVPTAQTARLAASELRHRGGDRQAAADGIAAAAGAGNSFDPWWSYVFGEYWRMDLLLNAVRAKRRA